MAVEAQRVEASLAFAELDGLGGRRPRSGVPRVSQLMPQIAARAMRPAPPRLRSATTVDRDAARDFLRDAFSCRMRSRAGRPASSPATTSRRCTARACVTRGSPFRVWAPRRSRHDRGRDGSGPASTTASPASARRRTARCRTTHAPRFGQARFRAARSNCSISMIRSSCSTCRCRAPASCVSTTDRTCG